MKGKGDALASFDGFFDLPEQGVIREDCKQLVGMSKLYFRVYVCK